MTSWGRIVAVALSLAPAGASAQAIQNVVLRNSFNPVGSGARGLGMGGAFIAVADDGTASSFNPSGLSQLRRSELALVGFGEELRSTLTVPRLTGGVEQFTAKNRHGAPDFAGLSVPFEVASRNLTVQLSYQRAVDLFGRGRATVQETIDLRDLDPDLRGTGDVIADITPEQSGAFHTASVAAGYQLTSRLSVGASLNYWIAEWTAQGDSSFRVVARPQGGPRTEVPLFNNRFRQEQGMRGINLNGGVLLRYPRLSLGAVVRLPFAGDYDLVENDLHTEFDSNRPLPPTPFNIAMTSRLHWPRSAGVGVALRPFRGLTLAGDYTRSHWSRAFIEDVVGGALLTDLKRDAQGEVEETFTNRNFFDLLPASQTSTVDTDQWRAGAEYLVASIPKVVIPFRGGLFRDRSPVTDITGEARRIEGWTAGTGLNFSRLVLDVAFERRESEGVVALRLRQGEAVAGANVPTETVRQDRLVASLIYRAGGDDDPLKRALRYLFVGSEKKE